MANLTTICGGCGQPVSVLAGLACCTTVGCKLQTANLPESKTGLSSANKPVVDPAIRREEIAMERTMGWTAPLPFTECTCWDDCGQPIQVPPHLDSCPQSPLYNPDRCTECQAVGFHKMSCGQGYAGQGVQYEDENGDVSFGPWDATATPVIMCTLCTMIDGVHEKTCLAQPGHSCVYCGRPIHHVSNQAGWIHDSTNDFQKCGNAATPKAKKLTGTCVHGNALVHGCQACDWDDLASSMKWTTEP